MNKDSETKEHCSRCATTHSETEGCIDQRDAPPETKGEVLPGISKSEAEFMLSKLSTSPETKCRHLTCIDCPSTTCTSDVHNKHCQDCGEHGFFHSTPPETSSWDWKQEFREYFDAKLKPKKPTMQNLDRELLVDFISKIASSEYKRGVEEGQKNMLIAIEKIEEMSEEGFEDLRTYLDSK